MSDAEIRHHSKMVNATIDSSCDLATRAILKSDIAEAVILKSDIAVAVISKCDIEALAIWTNGTAVMGILMRDVETRAI